MAESCLSPSVHPSTGVSGVRHTTSDTTAHAAGRPVAGARTPYRGRVSEMTDARTGWLSREDLEQARERLPLVYVDAIPVRVDERGVVVAVGLLLRAMPDGSISRAPVSGRVLYGERIRDALMRHLEKDLGPMALPRVPTSPQPFTVAEYFPDPEVSGFHDPRQHAVSLAYVVPVSGDCVPSTDALDLQWLTPDEAASDTVALEMTGGQDRLLRLALAHVGVLP
jgi:ADP-ribose pyrophosphatase YjhB (NUDIX family)